MEISDFAKLPKEEREIEIYSCLQSHMKSDEDVQRRIFKKIDDLYVSVDKHNALINKGKGATWTLAGLVGMGTLLEAIKTIFTHTH